MKAPAVRPYHHLAQYYDDFFSPVRIPLDAARERLLRRILPGVKTACDLACGTGTTAISQTNSRKVCVSFTVEAGILLPIPRDRNEP